VLRQTIAEDGRRICIVAGADFAHVGPQFGDPAPVDRRFSEHVEAGDRAMLDLIARGDADGFYHQIVHEAPGPGMAGDARAVGGPRRICGLAPIYATLCLLGPSDGRVLHYDQWIDQRGAGSVTFGCVAFP
jgi:predicted class III extradiol MEMO1 family dioxygenase